MKLTVRVGNYSILVPCADGRIYAEKLVDLAVQRYMHIVNKKDPPEVLGLQTSDGASVDLHDVVADICSDGDKFILLIKDPVSIESHPTLQSSPGPDFKGEGHGIYPVSSSNHRAAIPQLSASKKQTISLSASGHRPVTRPTSISVDDRSSSMDQQTSAFATVSAVARTPLLRAVHPSPPTFRTAATYQKEDRVSRPPPIPPKYPDTAPIPQVKSEDRAVSGQPFDLVDTPAPSGVVGPWGSPTPAVKQVLPGRPPRFSTMDRGVVSDGVTKPSRPHSIADVSFDLSDSPSDTRETGVCENPPVSGSLGDPLQPAFIRDSTRKSLAANHTYVLGGLIHGAAAPTKEVMLTFPAGSSSENGNSSKYQLDSSSVAIRIEGDLLSVLEKSVVPTKSEDGRDLGLIINITSMSDIQLFPSALKNRSRIVNINGRSLTSMNNEQAQAVFLHFLKRTVMYIKLEDSDLIGAAFQTGNDSNSSHHKSAGHTGVKSISNGGAQESPEKVQLQQPHPRGLYERSYVGKPSKEAAPNMPIARQNGLLSYKVEAKRYENTRSVREDLSVERYAKSDSTASMPHPSSSHCWLPAGGEQSHSMPLSMHTAGRDAIDESHKSVGVSSDEADSQKQYGSGRSGVVRSRKLLVKNPNAPSVSITSTGMALWGDPKFAPYHSDSQRPGLIPETDTIQSSSPGQTQMDDHDQEDRGHMGLFSNGAAVSSSRCSVADSTLTSNAPPGNVMKKTIITHGSSMTSSNILSLPGSIPYSNVIDGTVKKTTIIQGNSMTSLNMLRSSGSIADSVFYEDEVPSEDERPIEAPTPKTSSQESSPGQICFVLLHKTSSGYGFTLASRDASVSSPGPIYIKNVLYGGAAEKDGRIRAGDRVLKVNGQDTSGMTMEEVVQVLRSSSIQVELVLLREAPPTSQYTTDGSVGPPSSELQGMSVDASPWTTKINGVGPPHHPSKGPPLSTLTSPQHAKMEGTGVFPVEAHDQWEQVKLVEMPISGTTTMIVAVQPRAVNQGEVEAVVVSFKYLESTPKDMQQRGTLVVNGDKLIAVNSFLVPSTSADLCQAMLRQNLHDSVKAGCLRLVLARRRDNNTPLSLQAAIKVLQVSMTPLGMNFITREQLDGNSSSSNNSSSRSMMNSADRTVSAAADSGVGPRGETPSQVKSIGSNPSLNRSSPVLLSYEAAMIRKKNIRISTPQAQSAASPVSSASRDHPGSSTADSPVAPKHAESILSIDSASGSPMLPFARDAVGRVSISERKQKFEARQPPGKWRSMDSLNNDPVGRSQVEGNHGNLSDVSSTDAVIFRDKRDPALNKRQVPRPVSAVINGSTWPTRMDHSDAQNWTNSPMDSSKPAKKERGILKRIFRIGKEKSAYSDGTGEHYVVKKSFSEALKDHIEISPFTSVDDGNDVGGPVEDDSRTVRGPDPPAVGSNQVSPTGSRRPPVMFARSAELHLTTSGSSTLGSPALSRSRNEQNQVQTAGFKSHGRDRPLQANFV